MMYKIFNIKNEIAPLLSFSSWELKRNTYLISTIILFISLLIIDHINVHTCSNCQPVFLFIKNIYLLIPLGLVYLFAPSFRSLLKNFTFTYCSLMLLVVSSFQASNNFEKIQNKNEEFEKGLVNMYMSFINDEEFSQMAQAATSPALNKFRQFMEFSKQENKAIVQAFYEIDLNSSFTDEVLFSFERLIEKKKKFKELFIALIESKETVLKRESEIIRWVLFSPDIDMDSRKSFGYWYYMASPEESIFVRKESFNVRERIVWEYINFFDFLSKIYGTYERTQNHEMMFGTAKDAAIWNSHMDAFQKLYTCENLLKSEEDFHLLIQRQRMLNYPEWIVSGQRNLEKILGFKRPLNPHFSRLKTVGNSFSKTSAKT